MAPALGALRCLRSSSSTSWWWRLSWSTSSSCLVAIFSGTGGGLSGFLPGQHYSMTAEQTVDNPVPRRSFSGDLQGFSPGQSSSKRTANKIADIPVPRGAFTIFLKLFIVQGFRPICRRRQIKGFLALFPGKNKCEDSAHPGVGTGCAVELMDAMSSAGLEHGGQGDRHGCGYLLVAERQERSWLVLLLLVYPLAQWLEQPLVQAVHGCRLSAKEAFGRISSSTCLPCRVVRT